MAAILLVPSTSWSHEQKSTSSLSGTISRVTGGIKVSLSNTGTDAFTYFWIRMPVSVHHTGAMIDRGGGCGPGPDANTVKCGVSNAGFQPGDTYTVTITTDGPYPANGGADLFTGPGTNGPLVPAGKATGPEPQPCTCKSLTAKILANSIRVEQLHPDEKGGLLADTPVKVDFTLVWTLTCTEGDGGCAGTIRPSSKPGVFVNHGTSKATAVICKSACGETRIGSMKGTLVGAEHGLNRTALANATLPVVVNRTCGARKLPPVRLSITFDRVGRPAIAKSRLG